MINSKSPVSWLANLYLTSLTAATIKSYLIENKQLNESVVLEFNPHPLMTNMLWVQ